MENDEEHAQKAAPDAHLQKLSGVGHDGLRQEEGIRDLVEFFTEGDIFQNTLAGKAPELFEQCAADEEGLVAVNDPAADAAEIIEERDQLEPPIIARELVHVSSGLDGLVWLHLVQPLNRTGRQDRIGMEKEQPVAARFLRSGVHLGGTALGCAKSET